MAGGMSTIRQFKKVMFEIQLKDRFVTKIGTVYCSFLGCSDTADQNLLTLKNEEIKALKGQRIKINGVESNVLESRVSSRCNLINRNYYIEILTDEEFSI